MHKKLVVSAAAAALVAAGTVPALASGSTSAAPTQFKIESPTGLLTCTTTLDYRATHNPHGLVPSYSLTPLGNVDVNASSTVAYGLYDAGAAEAWAICVLI